MYERTANDILTPEVKLKSRSDLHLARKLFHAGGIFFIIGLFQVLSRTQSLVAVFAAMLLFIPLDFFRHKHPKVNEIFIRGTGRWMRSSEMHALTGSSYLLVGVFVVISLFPKDIATLSLALLALGDPIASLVGIMYGKDKIVGNKSLQGTLAGFVVCTCVAFAFYYSQNIMLERIVLVSVLTGIIGAVAELIPIGKLDDNFTFPVLSAILIWCLFHLFGGFI